MIQKVIVKPEAPELVLRVGARSNPICKPRPVEAGKPSPTRTAPPPAPAPSEAKADVAPLTPDQEIIREWKGDAVLREDFCGNLAAFLAYKEDLKSGRTVIVKGKVIR